MCRRAHRTFLLLQPMRNLFCTVLMSLLMASLWGQRGSCSVSTADSTRFLLSVNGVSWGDSAQTAWTFVGDPGTYTLTMLPVDSLATLLTSEVEVTAGVERNYMLMFGDDRSKFFLAVTAETTYNPSGDYAEASMIPAAREAASGVQVANATPFAEVRSALRGAVFQKERIAMIEDYLLGHSLSVAQLSELLSAVDAEDARLALALKAAPKLTDPQNLEQLDQAFYLSSSRKKLHKAVGQ